MKTAPLKTNATINIDKAAGLCVDAHHLSSSHYSDRPEGVSIDLLVIHCISLPPGEFASDDIKRFFCGEPLGDHPYYEKIRDMRVSSHVLIDREGQITQFVPFTKAAWHAGASAFQGRKGCNDFSIGVELIGAEDVPFTEAQYGVLIALTRALMEAYPAITWDHIVGHSDIAPGRKTDPGELFDWSRVLKDL